MHGLRSFYYKNKYKVWGVIIFIVLLILCIQFMNKLVAEQNSINIVGNINTTNETNKKETTNTYMETDRSVITGNEINEDKLEEANNLIEEFISECNNGNIEKVYNLISDDCKEELYPNIEDFKNLYYNPVFGDGQRKMATIENWILNTYKVNITEDILATGQISDKKIEDYITIVSDGEDLKLNINEFIGKKDINITQTIDDIVFNIVEKKIYMDYEKYTVQVENRTENTIVLDSQENTKSIYLTDINNVKYYSYSHELLTSLLKINSGFATQLEIKFFKGYSSKSKDANYIVFSDVILNVNDKEPIGKSFNISI